MRQHAGTADSNAGERESKGPIGWKGKLLVGVTASAPIDARRFYVTAPLLARLDRLLCMCRLDAGSRAFLRFFICVFFSFFLSLSLCLTVAYDCRLLCCTSLLARFKPSKGCTLVSMLGYCVAILRNAFKIFFTVSSARRFRTVYILSYSYRVRVTVTYYERRSREAVAANLGPCVSKRARASLRY